MDGFLSSKTVFSPGSGGQSEERARLTSPGRYVWAVNRKATWRLFGGILTAFIVAVLWIIEPYGASQALAECLRHTTVKMMPLPEGCIQANETPPANLMR